MADEIPRSDLSETRTLFPHTPHTWLDSGRLLLLTEPRGAHNAGLFRRQWTRAQPVLVSNCHLALAPGLWTPAAFSVEFGHLENDLVDCANKVRRSGPLCPGPIWAAVSGA